MVQAQADLLGLDVTMFEAVTPDSYETKLYSALPRIYNRRELLYPKHVALIVSHVNALLDMLKHGYEEVLILEDDVDMDFHVEAKVKQLRERFRSANTTWDILLLGHCFAHPKTEVVKGVHTIGIWACTHGYAVKKSYVEKMLSEPWDVPEPYDVALEHRCKQHKCNLMAVMPMLFAQVPRVANYTGVTNNVLPDQNLEDSTLKRMNKTLSDFA